MATGHSQFGTNQAAGPSDSSSFSTPSAPRIMNSIGNGAGISVPSIPPRASSPTKQPEAKPANTPKNDRPIDIRAEEDAARRYNIGRVVGNNRYGAGSRGKRTDLFGPELKMKLERMAKDHQVTFDDESLAYLSMAAETRLRDILSSSISAQQHRTTTSYLHPPPTAPQTTGSGNKGKERAMWAVSVNSDPNALLEVLNKQAKEAEREFRTSRMTRLAREHEMDRFRDRQNGGESGQAETFAQQTSPNDDTVSTSANVPTATSPDRANSPLPKADVNATPTFGGVSAKKINRGKKTATFSPDVQIKMSNATAIRSTGMGKKYSWMNNAPNISSPLSGRKKGKKGQQEEETEDGDQLGEDTEGSKKRKKSTLSNEVGEESGKRQKKRRMPSLPSRRMVPVSAPGPPGLTGNEKLVPDDRCLTMADFVFALERDGGKGMGTGDEIVRRAMARPGGPWGVAQARRP